jgi:RecA-family ATPase
MAVCIAAGIPFFSLDVIGRRRVLYLSCEDREAILHWRLARICAYLKVNLSTLRGWLEIIDLVGQNTVLWAHRPAVGFSATTQFYILRDRVAEHESQILMIDGISDTYAGNENIRAEVKQFVNAGVSVIPFNDGALILIGHVAKPDSIMGGDGAGYAGSTGWHNAARARWYLYPETIVTDENKRKPERTGNLLMELQKSNFGHIDQSIKFAWNEQAGLFLGEGVINQSAFERKHRDREEQRALVLAFKSCAESVPPITVPAAKQGKRTAFNVLSHRPEFPQSLFDGRAGKQRFWVQIEALVQDHALEEIEIRTRGYHPTSNYRLTSSAAHICHID